MALSSRFLRTRARGMFPEHGNPFRVYKGIDGYHVRVNGDDWHSDRQGQRTAREVEAFMDGADARESLTFVYPPPNDFNVRITMDNHAFTSDRVPRQHELARILHALADRLIQVPFPDGDKRVLLDVNGNEVGEARMVAE